MNFFKQNLGNVNFHASPVFAIINEDDSKLYKTHDQTWLDCLRYKNNCKLFTHAVSYSTMDHTNLMQKATKTPGGRISITLSLFDDNDHRRANTYLFYHNNLPTISHEKEHTMQEWLKLTPLLINIYYFNRDQFQVLILSQWSVPGKGVCTRHHQQQ